MNKNHRKATSSQADIPLETQLGLLAMRFRGAKDETERDKVAAEYKRVVAKLIDSKTWEEMPAFEDMLPDDRMPAAFFEFWSIRAPGRLARGG